jgi:anti-sigma-K factor RskA
VNDALHTDVAAYAAGLLERREAHEFEAHLAGCARCAAELDELRPLADLLAGTAGPMPEPPPGLQPLTLLAVERAAVQPGPRSRPPLRRRAHRRRGLVLALACACAVTLGVLAASRERSAPLEVVATLRGEQSVATVEVVKTGIGRVVRFETDDLPILPAGDYYELWWVGPRDSARSPNRISAGTFHPDEDGVSRVTFAAAVDPAKYPRLAVTAEPGDGDPAPHGPDVLRGRVRPAR